ncbi:thioredoxin [Candidatus Halobonum tyrrellensis]|uniref:Thioredoxin n=1 Tax=Candidatus Halobonum tyrrellensis G22 TaxID=1324957 RepID=V4HAB3_9EURY|nr:thioredoxin [Candidatus Halobonum tyrrellensis]ESP87650.1 thioredoxin [Candidatus Halobonum tyrrellensis G22]
MSSQTSRSEPVHVESTEQFEELTSEGIVLVDYHADWCGPCQMLAPTVEELAAEVDDLTVLKVDVDEHQALAQEAGVRGIPALQFYADGEEAERLVGVQEKEDLLDVVESLR